MTTSPATADLIDAHGDQLQSCEIQFRQFGGRRQFHGPVRTAQTLGDNALIKQLLASPGAGAVLVVDGGGSLRTALMGDMIAGSAQQNGWAGIIIYGAVRDTVALGKLDLGVKALGSNPRKSAKNATGAIDMPVTFGGATFAPGAWVYCDDDGIVVSQRELP
jgi:regulator of ribonuclease activity A